MENKVSLWQIFTVFAGIGAFTIGGGYAMIPLVESAMRRRDWIPEDEMPDITVLAQSAPGLLAVNMAIYCGWRLRGLKGAVAATLGAVLPSFVIILLVAMLFTEIRENPIVERIFRGIRPVAVGLIIIPAVNMARRGCRSWWQWLLCAGTLAAIVLLKFSPIYIILVTIVVAVAVTLIKQRK
ncbi:MAG: chromate transporter [Bacteroidales bacterium]|nr:chromate transporter [Bacteroidales bacterium]